jgi:hypothetical protein
MPLRPYWRRGTRQEGEVLVCEIGALVMDTIAWIKFERSPEGAGLLLFLALLQRLDVGGGSRG